MHSQLDPITEFEQGITAEFSAEFSLANFAEEVTPESAIAVLRYLLRIGGDGYKGEISAFEPPPSAENNWLWDERKNGFVGIFIDPDPETRHSALSFEIIEGTDGAVRRSFRPAKH